MKLLVDRLLFGARAAVVAGAVLALVVAGAASAQRVYADQYMSQAPRTQADTDILDRKPDPTETAGGMTAPEGGRPCTEQSAWLQTVTALPSSGDKVALESGHAKAAAVIHSQTSGQSREDIFSTSAQVASHVARLFTLVGARPSGTS